MADSNSLSELLNHSPAELIGYCSLFTTLILLGSSIDSLLTALVDKYTPDSSELTQAGIKVLAAFITLLGLVLVEKTAFTIERTIKRKKNNNNNYNKEEPLLSGSLRDN